MDAEWKEYEHMVVKYHQQSYESIVWHTDVIPEEELMNAGFIHDFNKHRLTRIARKREAKGKSIKYSDYGMDFLSKDKDGKYHAGQAKHYTKRKVTANDLGSFLSIVYCRIKNPSYLYTSGDIEINLKEDIQNTNGMIIHEHLKYKKENTQISNKNETEYELRPYQIEAIDAILDVQDEDDDYTTDNRKALELFCGGGKTTIAGHVLQKSSYNLIICIAPLKASVEQLKTRLTPFLASYNVLLVDSDNEGTTDIEQVCSFCKNRTKPIIIFSTYKSTEDVLTEVITTFTDDMFLLVDEVHNMMSKDKLCQFANSFKNSLLLSATIPEEMYEILSVSKCYSYNMSDAIKKGYCCDYEVFLPYINGETNEIDVDIPTELIEYDKSLSAKAMFLATGMLQTGSRRCVVYLASQEECDAFLKVIQASFREYHGIECWGEKIDSTVSSKKRQEILNEFQSSGDNHIMRIITSVRILDEAIDIPKCDSEFITVVGEQTSDIRTIQRLCRGCRIDTDNPSKKNNLFMWCSDWSNTINCLTLLKDADVEFKKKIRTISSNYDVQGTQEEKELKNKQSVKLQDYIKIKCLSLGERWEMRRQQWIEQYQKLEKRPSRRSQDENERKAGYWQSCMRTIKKGKGTYNITEEQIDILNTTRGWTWEEPDTFNEQLDNWIKQHQEVGKKPNSKSKDEDEKRAGCWQQRMREANKNGDKARHKLTPEEIEKLNNTLGWTWEEPNAFVIQYNNWTEQYQKLGKKPNVLSKDINERKAGQWQSDMRKFKKGQGKRKLTKEQVDMLDNTRGWTWEEPDAFVLQYNNWVEQYRELGRKPKHSSTNAMEKTARKWQDHIRDARNGKGTCKITLDQIQILDNTQGWTWEVTYSFTEQFNNWIEEYQRLGRQPSCGSKDENERRAGRWQQNIRKAERGKAKRNLTEEQIEILNNTQGWKWEG